ncbi:MAG: hypothetical protein JXQ73_30520 [Phycisphaerae bacterium]|nr:hypothetical protein [Phycisphaerae bacterium]
MPQQPLGTDAGMSPLGPDAATPTRYTPIEFEEIYQRMVADELARGPLPYRRRRKLMRYATQIGIKPFRASLLIAEAQRQAGHVDDPELQHPDPITPLVHPERWPIWFKLTAAMIVATLVDLMIIRAVGW